METSPKVGDKRDQPNRQKSGISFPSYALADSVAVAETIHNKAGGYATRDQLAAFLGYKSTLNGAFISRVSSARIFGLIEGEADQLKLTPLAVKILMPDFPEQAKASLVEAFFTIPLFKAIYDEYHGKTLPEGLGFDNALRTKFQVVPKRLYFARKTFWESAETAGFFETKGSKTHLIIPTLKSQPKVPDQRQQNENLPKGGGGGEQPPVNPARTKDDLQNEYIGTLIEVLREKSKQGEMDQDLMERIERLLQLKNN